MKLFNILQKDFEYPNSINPINISILKAAEHDGSALKLKQNMFRLILVVSWDSVLYP